MDKFRSEILDLLKSLNFQKQLVFGVLICEKLLPNYTYFSKIMSWGSPDKLQNTIFKIYQYIYNYELFSVDEIQDLIIEIELNTPDTNDFESIFVSFALDSCTSLLSTLTFILDKNIENMVDVASYPRDTVDMYVQEKEDLAIEDKQFELKIEQNYYMQQEKTRQKTVLQLLKNMNKISDKELQELRNIQPSPIIDLHLLSSFDDVQ